VLLPFQPFHPAVFIVPVLAVIEPTKIATKPPAPPPPPPEPHVVPEPANAAVTPFAPEAFIVPVKFNAPADNIIKLPAPFPQLPPALCVLTETLPEPPPPPPAPGLPRKIIFLINVFVSLLPKKL